MARLIFKLSTRSSKQYRSKGIEEFYWEKRIVTAQFSIFRDLNPFYALLEIEEVLDIKIIKV